MSSTDTCPCTTDRHRERLSQGNYQSGRGSATRQQWSHLVTQPAEKGSPRKGSQSPPQSSTKPPDSAERCEWLSAAMRLAGRLAGRPFSPCFTLVSRTFHARSLPAIIWQFTGLAPSLTPKAANQYKTAPTWSPSSAPPPTQCDIHGGLFGGFGGSGESGRLTS